MKSCCVIHLQNKKEVQCPVSGYIVLCGKKKQPGDVNDVLYRCVGRGPHRWVLYDRSTLVKKNPLTFASLESSKTFRPPSILRLSPS